MNKKAILATVKTVYSDEDEGYIANSPLWELTSAFGETPEEAFNEFVILFEMDYEDYITGKHIKSPVGRPAKGKTRFHAEVDPDIKQAIAMMGKKLHMSQGEVVEYLFKSFQQRT